MESARAARPPAAVQRPVRPLSQKADFQRALATPSRSRSTHFAVHHVDAGPAAPNWRRKHPAAAELSTGAAHGDAQAVENAPGAESEPPAGRWLGTVVPKRHARRSVTRVLLKRQIRAAMERHAEALPPGLWVVRLRAPFAVAQFPSAASDALRTAARAELEQLFGRARAVRA